MSYGTRSCAGATGDKAGGTISSWPSPPSLALVAVLQALAAWG